MARWRRAMVTGASAGIGAAIAQRLAADGVDLVLVARRAERLEDLAATWRSPLCRVDVIAADLTRADDVERVARRLADADEPIDLLVNNAGLGHVGRFWEHPLEAATVQIATNVDALVRLTHAALGRMVPEGRGTVVNVSSIAGNQPAPGSAVYAATKAFVTNFSEGLAEELRGSAVTVTAVCPGLTRTEFHAVAGVGEPSDRTPGALWMSAEDVAAEALAAAAKGKVVHVTGVRNKVVAGLSAASPRVLRRRAAAFVMERGGRLD